ncbi:hypothetical protein ABZ319_00630 [Nocardia sp. NPDC005978]|uniref:hypothetical protein n=1 Tax=Nocardia sp. NPDC005978 TaxID=3156725 RepID=UPI0033A1C96D
MALTVTEWLITSDTTPETAHYIPTARGGEWVLSWLPDRALNREQAISGMVLDEFLSDPAPADDVFALELADVRAAQLGIELEDAILRLCARMLERVEPPAMVPDAPHAWRIREFTVPHRVRFAALSIAAVLARTLYAVATLPSLCFVGAALIVSRLTDSGWALVTATLATATLAGVLTLIQIA